MQALKEVSEALVQNVEDAGAGLVRVEARRRLPASGIVWSPEGIIVTAHHVVQREDGIQVGLPDGGVAPATLIGRDASTDLAVLQADAKSLSPVQWAQADDLKVGHLVLALGRPGKAVNATMGIVSAWGAAWRTPAGGELDRYLQTDVVMYPGFSGGLLLNASGQGLGMNTSALLRGVSVTVPGTTLSTIVPALLEHGRVRRGYLGVSLQPVRLPKEIAADLAQQTAVLIVSVEPGSPAEAGGLHLGDTITAMDGRPVKQLDDLMVFLAAAGVGTAVELTVLRGGDLRSQKVTLGEREAVK